MSKGVRKNIFYFGANCTEVILIISLLANLSRSEILGNAQNERAAIIEDDVRRGLGMLHQRAIFEKASEGDFAKMSKPVQVCTACQFVQAKNDSGIIPELGMISQHHLWLICPQAEIFFRYF